MEELTKLYNNLIDSKSLLIIASITSFSSVIVKIILNLIIDKSKDKINIKISNGKKSINIDTYLSEIKNGNINVIIDKNIKEINKK